MHLLFGLTLVLSPVHAGDWPHWRGPNRDGTATEDSGWERSAWPPKEVWQASVGLGSTSPLVVGGRLYTMGWAGGSDHVLCLEAATGKEAWRQSYPCPSFGRKAAGDQGMYGGPTSTPEYDEQTKYLYTLSIDGDLRCWDTGQQGRPVWRLNLYEQYRMPQRPAVGQSGQRDYGYTTAPLVLGELLLVEVGGNAGTVIAFDKRTGQERWASQAKDLAGHTGGMALMQVEGVPCLATLTFNGLLVLRLDRGREGTTVGQYPYQTEFANSIAGPAVEGNEVLVTSGYNHKTITKLRVTLHGVTKEWEEPRVYSQVCTPVIHKGFAYWAWANMYCLELATGRTLWKDRVGGSAGSCIRTADERLIVWANEGDLSLLETAQRSPGTCRVLARVPGLFHTEVWPHVALSTGRLYCKDRAGHLKCLSLRPEDKPVAPAMRARQPREETTVVLKDWPGELPELVLAWRKGFGIGALGPGAATRDRISLRPRGTAKFDADGNLEVTGGAFLTEGANQPLLEACRASGELSVEVTLRTDNLAQSGPARLVSFSTDPYHRNFTLGQERDRLVFRLRTPQTGDNGMNPETSFGRIEAGKWHHVLVTYRDGELTGYLDGRVVVESDAVRGDFSNWADMPLLIGDEFQDPRDWSGTVERVSIHSRHVGADEARQRFKLFAGAK